MEQEIEEFYSKIEGWLNTINVNKNKELIITGDWNSHVGLKHGEEEDILGNFGYGKWNERG